MICKKKMKNPFKKNCNSNFDSCSPLSPAAVQLRKLVVQSTKSPRRRFQVLQDEKRSFESRRHST